MDILLSNLYLNISKLIAIVSAEIEDIFDVLDTLTNDDGEKLIQGFEQNNADGQYEEFCFAIASILQQYSIA